MHHQNGTKPKGAFGKKYLKGQNFSDNVILQKETFVRRKINPNFMNIFSSFKRHDIALTATYSCFHANKCILNNGVLHDNNVRKI